MESFSQKAKAEIMASQMESIKSVFYEIYALILFACSYSESENTFFAPPETNVATSRIINLSRIFSKTDKNVIKIRYSSESAQKEIKICLPFKIDVRENTDNIKIDDLFIHSFLRGAFLACASIVNPENEYHLEFCVSSEKLKNLLISTMHSSSVNFDMKTIYRRNAYVIYSKSAEKITDLLVFIGAKNCAMELMQIKMIKEMRNNINRTTNFETANITKTTNSATTQIEAIKKIKKHKKFEELPDSLKEVANLRTENPYLSLEDLSKKSSLKITKSGINHRLQKIIEISKELA